jgi:hypothetical protein
VPGAVAGGTEFRRLDLLHLRVLVHIRAFPLHDHLGAAALRACIETPLILAHTSPSAAVARVSVFTYREVCAPTFPEDGRQELAISHPLRRAGQTGGERNKLGEAEVSWAEEGQLWQVGDVGES